MAHRKRLNHSVTASELAQMGMCERRVVFEHRLGKRSTASQREACRHGVAAHECFYQEVVRASDKKRSCDITPLELREGPETAALKCLWVRLLRKTVLVRHTGLQPLVQMGIRLFSWVAERVLRRKGRKRDR